MVKAKKSGKIDNLVEVEKAISEREKRLEKKENEIISLEKIDQADEKKVEELEKEQQGEMQKLEDLEKDIKKQVIKDPLTKITYRDITKGIIGAFIGIVGHFAFLEGMHLAEAISILRATLLLITAFLIGTTFIYFSGFRKVKEIKILSFIPLRITVIYFVAMLVIVIVLALFGQITVQSSFGEIYKKVASISILAIVGACAADLIGKE